MSPVAEQPPSGPRAKVVPRPAPAVPAGEPRRAPPPPPAQHVSLGEALPPPVPPRSALMSQPPPGAVRVLPMSSASVISARRNELKVNIFGRKLVFFYYILKGVSTCSRF